MKNFLLLIVLTGFLFAGCKKEDKKPECEVNNFGWVEISNNKDDPYELSVNGGFIYNLNPGKTYTYKGAAGVTYEFKLKQISGYLIYPSVYTSKVHIEQCSTKYLEIN